MEKTLSGPGAASSLLDASLRSRPETASCTTAGVADERRSGTPYAMDTFGGHVQTYFDAVGNPGLNFAPWPIVTYEIVPVTREQSEDIGLGRSGYLHSRKASAQQKR